MGKTPVSVNLLAWYDDHARQLPWRIGPAERCSGVQPDPYRVWLSEIMLQQTTVAAVRDYFLEFTDRWPTVSALAAASEADIMAAWAGLGYYARARNLVKCARVVAEDLGGRFPDTYSDLIKLSGIGPYTASAIASIAFDRPETVLDGNVERVMSRLNAITDPLPGSKETLRGLAAQHTPDIRPGDYAQAVMDLGATICTPRSPACGICPVKESCKGRIEGIHKTLPRKTPKSPKPVRHGVAYVVQHPDGRVLLERRPDTGLLGGTLCFPCSEWTQEPAPNPPLDAEWHEAPEVRHTFTHFHLRLRVLTAQSRAVPKRGTFLDGKSFNRSDLPGLMRKVHDVASLTL